MDKVTINFEEASQLMGCSPRYLRQLDKEGKAPPIIRFGRNKRFMKDSVIAWLKEQEYRPLEQKRDAFSKAVEV